MADASRRRGENVDGPWFVDDTCIDCGTCMWMAPQVFAEAGDMSAVHSQAVEGDADASAALYACPTGSIGGPAAPPAFPRPATAWDGATIEGAWHLGFHDQRSFGAASWLVRTDAGLVLVDVPRFAGPLRKGLADIVAAEEAAGRAGVVAIVLSHRDDVAAHQQWADHLGVARFMHRDDDVIGDQLLEGEGGRLHGLDWLHVPGHTRGSVVYRLARPDGDVLLTGDHLAGSIPRADRPARLRAFRGACWYDWGAQQDSMRRLQEWAPHVVHVLPGHGAPWHGTPEEYGEAIAGLLAWMAKA